MFVMGNRKISNDLKVAALRMKGKQYSMTEIVTVTEIFEATFYCTQRLKQLTGTLVKAQAIGRGRPCKLAARDAQYLLKLAHFKPITFLNEYAWWLCDNRLVPASLATIHHTLKRAGLNVKHIQKLASERTPEICADFVHRISHYPANYLMCLDEVSKDDRI